MMGEYIDKKARLASVSVLLILITLFLLTFTAGRAAESAGTLSPCTIDLEKESQDCYCGNEVCIKYEICVRTLNIHGGDLYCADYASAEHLPLNTERRELEQKYGPCKLGLNEIDCLCTYDKQFRYMKSSITDICDAGEECGFSGCRPGPKDYCQLDAVHSGTKKCTCGPEECNPGETCTAVLTATGEQMQCLPPEVAKEESAATSKKRAFTPDCPERGADGQCKCSTLSRSENKTIYDYCTSGESCKFLIGCMSADEDSKESEKGAESEDKELFDPSEELEIVPEGNCEVDKVSEDGCDCGSEKCLAGEWCIRVQTAAGSQFQCHDAETAKREIENRQELEDIETEECPSDGTPTKAICSCRYDDVGTAAKSVDMCRAGEGCYSFGCGPGEEKGELSCTPQTCSVIIVQASGPGLDGKIGVLQGEPLAVTPGEKYSISITATKQETTAKCLIINGDKITARSKTFDIRPVLGKEVTIRVTGYADDACSQKIPTAVATVKFTAREDKDIPDLDLEYQSILDNLDEVRSWDSDGATPEQRKKIIGALKELRMRLVQLAGKIEE